MITLKCKDIPIIPVLETGKRGRLLLQSIDPCHFAERVRAQAAQFFTARGVRGLSDDAYIFFR